MMIIGKEIDDAKIITSKSTGHRPSWSQLTTRRAFEIDGVKLWRRGYVLTLARHHHRQSFSLLHDVHINFT